jgi:uncharacterized Zn finger protein
MSASDGSADHMHRGDVGGSFPPPTSPRTVRGGIRLQSRRGATSWWPRRWLAALEALGVADRLERGLDYARAGPVLALDVGIGAITATVQGTRREPYATRVEVTPLTQLEWLDVARVLGARAATRASLHAGSVPEDVEASFARAGVALFPTLEDDLRTSCTCADWASPCRHAAAVCHLAGEAFESDPLLMFRLRGIERDVLLALLGDDAREAAVVAGTAGSDAPRAVDVDRFWHGASEDDAVDAPSYVDLQPPVLDAPLVRVLGALPFWQGREDFEPAMQRIFARLASDTVALDVATGVSPRSAPRG